MPTIPSRRPMVTASVIEARARVLEREAIEDALTIEVGPEYGPPVPVEIPYRDPPERVKDAAYWRLDARFRSVMGMAPGDKL